MSQDRILRAVGRAMTDDHISGVVTLIKQLVNSLLKSAAADAVAENGDFFGLSLRLLVSAPGEVACGAEQDDEDEDTGHDTSNCARAEATRGNDGWLC